MPLLVTNTQPGMQGSFKSAGLVNGPLQSSFDFRQACDGVGKDKASR